MIDSESKIFAERIRISTVKGLSSPGCPSCKHFTGWMSCEAFPKPKIIPINYVSGEELHNEVTGFEKDGIIYELYDKIDLTGIEIPESDQEIFRLYSDLPDVDYMHGEKCSV